MKRVMLIVAILAVAVCLAGCDASERAQDARSSDKQDAKIRGQKSVAAF